MKPILYANKLLTPLKLKMVGLGRLELPTSPLSGVRSNQLSYRPIISANRKIGLAIAGLR